LAQTYKNDPYVNSTNSQYQRSQQLAQDTFQ